VGGSGSSGSGAAAAEQFDVDEETEEVTAPKELKTFRSVLEVTAPKGFVVKVLYDEGFYVWEQDTPFTVNEVKVALWYNALQQFGDLMQVADDIVIHKWGFPIDDDQHTFSQKVCLLKCTLRSSSGTAASSSAARRIALIENDKDEDEVAMMEAWCASTMDVLFRDGVEVELQFREDYEPGKTTYQIFVQTLKGETITLDISILDDVDSVKAMIEAKTGIPADQQRLICGGRRLEDVGANIKKEITLHLMLSLLGGMGKRGNGGDGNTSGLAEMRNTFGRGMKMIDENRVSDAANMTFNDMTRLVTLLAQNKTTPLTEALAGMNIEVINSIHVALMTTTITTRYREVAKILMPTSFDAIEVARQQLRDCEKVMIDGTILLLNSQYGTVATHGGSMAWGKLSEDLIKGIADRSMMAGAIAGAAAAHHADDLVM
jgi:hypothetical protein